jgi:hypothetical protein
MALCVSVERIDGLIEAKGRVEPSGFRHLRVAVSSLDPFSLTSKTFPHTRKIQTARALVAIG